MIYFDNNATTKVDKILNDAKEQVNAIHKVAEQKPNEYEEQDVKKALTITYAQTGVKLAKLYAPFVIAPIDITSLSDYLLLNFNPNYIFT